MMLKNFLAGMGFLCFFTPVWAVAPSDTGNDVSFVAPETVSGVRRPVLSLDGTWQFRYDPQGKWEPVCVPGELAMQGYAIRHDTPYTYRKTVAVPSDFKGKRIILRFDGVYGQARLSVNGTFVREHHGGFTRWETDITDRVVPGRRNTFELEITDRLDDISYASGYAHHPIGGILRGVTLFARPEAFPVDFYTETRFDSLGRDAVLTVGYSLPEGSDADVSFTLKAPDGREIPLESAGQPRQPGSAGMRLYEFSVSAPLKWDAEHPCLYTLTVSAAEGGRETGRFNSRVGFREVKVVQDRMLVNGRPVKLRGACRHDIHPERGRSTTRELDSLDAVRFKESNMNFVRTSHYPPSEDFIEFCDRLGIYVECESAVCFVNTYRQKNYAPGASQDDPAFAGRYLSQCREMVKTFRSHPSVLFWSIGNESVYGDNFRQCYDWVKKTDATRPVIFSYPGSVSGADKIYDLLSMHYQNVHGDVSQWGMGTRGFQGHGIPALFDEWAHPACYTYRTLQDDPNIREFWGASIDMMWSGLFEAPGGLGGAIWGYVDEIFMLPVPKAGVPFWKEFARTAKPLEFQGNCVGYGEWGIVDVWRRPKPEFWSVKKAYSPVRLLNTQVSDFSPGERIFLPVYNRFDHTDFSEIRILYSGRGGEKQLEPLQLPPRAKGLLAVPAEAWEPGDRFDIRFYAADGSLVDAETVTLGDRPVRFPAARVPQPLRVEENDARFVVRGNGFEVPFDKTTGLICGAAADGRVVIEKGPFLYLDINLNHLSGAEVRKQADYFRTSEADWKLHRMTCESSGDCVRVLLAGTYGGVALDAVVSVFSDGRIDTEYAVRGNPNGYLRETGLLFYLPAQAGRIEWERKGYWSRYPEGAFAGNEGTASLYESRQAAYGQKPVQPWEADTKEYYYWADAGSGCPQPLTRKAKGMKENVYYYALVPDGAARGLAVVSKDASVACRLHKRADGQLQLYVNNRWDYPEIAWGNYCRTLEATPCFGKVRIQL